MNRFPAIALSVVCAASLLVHAQAGFAGKWQGSTPNGRTVALDLKVTKQQLTGTLTLAQESADITEGKVDDKTFSFKATVDGRTVTCSGRLVGDELEFAPEGVPNPVMLKRVK